MEKYKDEQLLDLLKLVAPGTPLREGLDNILRARTGALIAIGDSEKILSVSEGGFLIEKEFTPSRLYELAKMDGAIIVSKDLKKIMCANALLIPDPHIYSEETGTRHKTAERFAKQTGEMVICISHRRNIITIYKGSLKYVLKDTSVILSRADQAMQTLEKYAAVLENAVKNLSIMEFDDIVTLYDVARVLQRTEMIMRVANEIERYICELGNEGRLAGMQMVELLTGVEEQYRLVVEDYLCGQGDIRSDDIIKRIRTYPYDEMMDMSCICNALGYFSADGVAEMNVSPKGYRLMSKVPRVPSVITMKLIETFGNLQGILNASIDEMDAVEGIAPHRARAVKEGLGRMREQLMLESRRQS
ncbi:MAG: DNA integrity scanning protein DisA [Clostridiales bacterium]|nr:DNA integrity scanning protein DisA [Clostridiales bacterium]